LKVAVSAAEPSLDGAVDPRFGRCTYFVIVDTETMQYEVVPNTSQSAPHGAGIQSAQIIASKGVKVVLTGNVGPNAYQSLSAAGIQIVTGATGTVRKTITKYKKGDLSEASSPTARGNFGSSSGSRIGRGRRW
jgi:predicted Fe-Mo cluster-binding NifX family protein